MRSGASNCGTCTSRQFAQTYAVSGKKISNSLARSAGTNAFDSGDMPRSAKTSLSGALQNRQRCLCMNECGERFDVAARLRGRGGRIIGPRAIPANGPRECGVDIETRRPAKAGARFRAVEFEELGFVWLFLRIALCRGRAAPQCREAIDDGGHRADVAILWSEVPRLGE